MPKVWEAERGREGLPVPDRGEKTARVYELRAQILHERARLAASLRRRGQGQESGAPLEEGGSNGATEKDLLEL